jgi:hypothetical protein
MSVLPSATLSTARAIASWKFRTVQNNDVKPIEDWRESITPTSPALRWSHRSFEVARRFLLRRRRPVTARRTAARAMINHHSSAGLTTTTHATRRALCVVRTPPEPPGGCGLLSPCGRRSRRGVLGSGWGRLAARGAGGQRRRRRRGDFGLNTGIFFSKTTYIFWCMQVVSCMRAVWLPRRG